MPLYKLLSYINLYTYKFENRVYISHPSLGSTCRFALNFGTTGLSQFHKVADDTLEDIYDSLDSLYGEHIESIDLSNGVLTAVFKIMPRNPILISKNEDKSEIWYASHSGVDYFSLKPRETLLDSWKSNANNILLSKKIAEDIKKIVGN